MLVPRAQSCRSGRSGVTLVEMLVAMTILVVSAGMLSRTMIATSSQRALNHENGIVLEAARGIVEDMRNQEFADLFALYNSDPDDDPGGAGTAPGHLFVVPGLDALEGAPEGACGEIVFPAVPVVASTAVKLSETFVDARLGMPRDLNGDNVVDDQDHAGDYLVLPVRVQIQWKGRFGPRTYVLETMLAEFRRRDS